MAELNAGPIILGVSASMKPGRAPNVRSASRGLLDHALKVLSGVYPNVAMLDLADHPLPLFDGRSPEDHDDPELRAVHAAVGAASGLLLSVPSYWSGVSGVFKNFVDCLCGARYDDDGPTIFAGMPFGLLVVGADAQSARAASAQAEEILASTGAVLATPPLVVGNPREYSADDDAGGEAVTVAAALARCTAVVYGTVS